MFNQFKNLFQQPQKLFSFYIPKEVFIIGNINTELPCIVDGDVKGDIFSEKAITVGIAGNITGNLSASNIIVYGKVMGDVLAKEKLMVYENGSVQGSVKAKETIVKETGSIIQPLIEETIVTKKVVYKEKLEGVFAQTPIIEKDKTWF